MRTLIILLAIFALLAILSVNIIPVWAEPCETDDNGVCLLQPDIIQRQPGQTEASLGNYLRLLFKTLIGLAGGIAVLIIVVEGLKYIVSGVPGVKTESKGRIRDALVGLILALAAYLILYTINPDLIKLDFQPKQVNQTAPSNP